MPLRLADCWRSFREGNLSPDAQIRIAHELRGERDEPDEPDEWATGYAIALHDAANFFDGNLRQTGMIRLAEHLERCARCDEAFATFAADHARSRKRGRAGAPPRT